MCVPSAKTSFLTWSAHELLFIHQTPHQNPPLWSLSRDAPSPLRFNHSFFCIISLPWASLSFCLHYTWLYLATSPPAFARTLYTQYPHHRLSPVPTLIYRDPNGHRFTLRTRLRTQRASSLPLICPPSLISDHSRCSQGPAVVGRDLRYPFSSFRSLPNITPLKRPKIALSSHHPLPHNSPSPLSVLCLFMAPITTGDLLFLVVCLRIGLSP